MRRASLFAVLVLTACTPAGVQTASDSGARVGVEFVPDANGLAVSGSTKRIDFGRSPRGVVPVLNRELGDFSERSLAGCPSGVVQQLAWGDLVLSFTRERFVGWKNGDARGGQTCA